MMIATLLFGWATLQSGQSKSQAGLVGADEALRTIAAQSPKTARTAYFGKARDESNALIGHLRKLSASEASEAWVRLVQTWESELPEISNRNLPDQWEEIVMPALPEPATWPLIRERLSNLPPSAKRKAELALMDDLLGRDQEVIRYLESKRDPDKAGLKEDVFNSEHLISDAELPIAERTGNLDLFEKLILNRNLGDRLLPWDTQPNLVHVFGKGRAEGIIRQILQSSTSGGTRFEGQETQDLARTIVTANLGTIKSPPWDLVRGFGDTAFVMALVQHFGEESVKNTGSNHNSDLIYGLALAKRGDTAHAAKFLDSISGNNVDLRSFAKTRDEQTFLFDLESQLMAQRPVESVWPLYLQLGRSLGRMAEVKGHLAHWLSSHIFLRDKMALWLGRQAELDVAEGRVKEAISGYERAIEMGNTELASQLLELANVFDDHKSADFVAKVAKGLGTEANRLDLYHTYVEQGRISDAQRAILEAAQNVHNVNLNAEGHGRLLNADPETGTRLAELYYLEDRPKEILSLLREYPRWGAEDLSGLMFRGDRNRYSSYGERHGIAFYAAWALARTGQTAQARQVLVALPATVKDRTNLLNQLAGKAEIATDPLRPEPPARVRTLVEKAERLEWAHAYASALDAYMMAAGSKTVVASIMSGLYRCLATLGRPSDARSLVPVIVDFAVDRRNDAEQDEPLGAPAYDFLGDEDQIRSELSIVQGAQAKNPRVWLATAQFDVSVGDFMGAVESYQKALEIDPRSIPAWEGIAKLWPKHVATQEQTRTAVLKLKELAPETGLNYQSRIAFGAFSDKSALWPGYDSLKHLGKPGARASLFPLQASRKSLASGTHPIESGLWDSVAQTPGTFIGTIPEVHDLFP